MFGAQGYCVRSHRALARWLGVARLDLTLHGWANFVHVDDRSTFAQIANVLQADRLPTASIIRWVGRSGAVIRTAIRWFWRHYSDGDKYRVFGHLVRLPPAAQEAA